MDCGHVCELKIQGETIDFLLLNLSNSVTTSIFILQCQSDFFLFFAPIMLGILVCLDRGECCK